MCRLIGRSGSSANRSRWGVFLGGGCDSARLGKHTASLHLESAEDVNAKPCVSSDRDRDEAVVLRALSERKKKEKIHRIHDAAAPDALRNI